MTAIWATRGFSWGFRFLDKGELDDPLPAYEEAFAGLEVSDEGLRKSSRVSDGTRMVAIRMVDPEGRKDQSGRPIPHDFVLFDKSIPGLDISTINSVDDFRRLVWPHFEMRYERIWNALRPDRP